MTQEEKELLIKYIDKLAGECILLKSKKKKIDILKVLDLIVVKINKI